MAAKKEQRSEETKRSIISAAEKLFGEKGYEAVTIREIAKEAGCSHTTIYIYFQDKEALLHALSIPMLLQLNAALDTLAADAFLSADEKLRRMNERFIRFCLDHRSMYTLFFEAKSARSDEPASGLEVNRLRNHMFNIIIQLLKTNLNLSEGEQILSCSRIYSYMLRGIISTYTHSEESVDSIMSRLSPSFDDAFEALIFGFGRQINERRADS
ncbi:TetR/AcrR family transcriptional regulator [Paenibacillus sp. LHD-38]|uniref:TetR/AcrR family transcriptional regulator n=1 Tax=Paenibacillus sp. LHD-38 TaxID=3072143 RepID=UPI00280DF27F|nr:TetR/AcrR family transcriptional regulator [Paenibacillus sp. LHD-38]MDQ8733869.1 TetR/AcrR family transcriptional regulator [Paenibacillus sp. LHD-38]